MKFWLSAFVAMIISAPLFAGQVLPDQGYVTATQENCGGAGPTCPTGWSKVIDASGYIEVDLDALTVTINADACSVVGCAYPKTVYQMVQWNQETGALQAIDPSGNYYPDLYPKFTKAGTIQFGSQHLGYMLVATQQQ